MSVKSSYSLNSYNSFLYYICKGSAAITCQGNKVILVHVHAYYAQDGHRIGATVAGAILPENQTRTSNKNFL